MSGESRRLARNQLRARARAGSGFDEQEYKQHLLALEQQSDIGFCARQPEVENHSGLETPEVIGDVSGSVTTDRRRHRCGQTWQHLKVNRWNMFCRPWCRLFARYSLRLPLFALLAFQISRPKLSLHRGPLWATGSVQWQETDDLDCSVTVSYSQSAAS